MRRLAFFSAAVIAASITAVAVATSPASAAPVCHTTTTHLSARPDSDTRGGTWALDTMDRQVTFCEDSPGHYSATVKDLNGAFTTTAGASSPRQGLPLTKTITGNMTGGWTETFDAAPAFAGYGPAFDGKSYTGSDPTSSGAFVAADYGATVSNDPGMAGWSWTYKSCSESWTDADPTAGAAAADGDITGAPCPAVSPTKGTGVAPAPTHPAAAPARGGNAGSVPNPGVAPVAVPGASAPSVSPTASDSYNPLGVAPATTDPGFSVGPVVPAGDMAVAQSGGSHLAGYLIGAAVVLLGIVLALWLAIARHRRSTDEAPVGASTTRYAPGVAGSSQGDTAVMRAVDDTLPRSHRAGPGDES